MKLTDLIKTIRKTANRSAEEANVFNGALRISFDFRGCKHENVLVGAVPGCYIEYSCALKENSPPSCNSEIETIARIADTEGFFLLADCNSYRSAAEILVYYYSSPDSMPEPDDDTSEEIPFLDIILAAASDDDKECESIERDIISAIISFFGEEHFRFETY